LWPCKVKNSKYIESFEKIFKKGGVDYSILKEMEKNIPLKPSWKRLSFRRPSKPKVKIIEKERKHTEINNNIDYFLLKRLHNHYYQKLYKLLKINEIIPI